MNNAWKEFIAEHESELVQREASGVTSNLVADGSSWVAQLGSRAILKVSGSDATEFLHGQFSNDLKQLTGNQWQLSSYSSPKGRLLAVFRIAKHKDNYYLEMPSNIIDSFQKRLQMFVMRSAVTLENLTDEFVICALVGDVVDQLKSVGVDSVADEYAFACSSEDDVLVLREYGAIPRYVIIAQAEKMITLWKSFGDAVTRLTENSWSLSQIEHGQPDVFDSTKEQFVAQMMNLHVLGAVNFKKGCYPGQEVVARLQYLGKLKRRMYRFSCESQALPVAGSEVTLEGATDAAGKVVSSAFVSDASIELLAVMKVASVDSQNTLALSSGEPLQLLELPYTFPEES